MSKRTTRPRATVGQTLARIERKLKALPAPGESLVPHIPPEQQPLVTLTEAIQLGAFGLERVKLTPEQELILSEPVKVEDIRVKPTGQPYVSHPTYTRWFNRAFGRFGWAVTPRSKPMKSERDGAALIMLAYTLDIYDETAQRMRSVAIAWGEQEMSWRNKEQTEGDAVEATVASALRRLAKRMGVGLEMWDRPFLDEYIATHCVCVKVVKNVRDGGGWTKKAVKQWRRKVDQPFPEELGAADRADAVNDIEFEEDYDRGAVPAQRREPSPRAAGTNSKAEDPISDGQVRRFHAIVTNSRRLPETVSAWMKQKYGYASSKDIKRKHYDAICEAVESKERLS